jgi:hypothetical protein
MAGVFLKKYFTIFLDNRPFCDVLNMHKFFKSVRPTLFNQAERLQEATFELPACIDDGTHSIHINSRLKLSKTAAISN